MKKGLYIIALLLLTIGFAGCEKESAGLTSITYYATIELNGGETMIVSKDSTFTDPGFVATMNGVDVSDQVVVEGEVDTSTSGVYTITYSMTNEDGFPSSVTRTVIVLNLSDPVEGFWTCDPASYRIYNGGAQVPYGAAFQILIIGEGSGVYFVEDLMAGWYAQRAGYGENYAMQAEIQVADDGTISLLDSYVPGWGDSADALENAAFDASSNTITYKLTYAGVIEFYVTLNKVDL